MHAPKGILRSGLGTLAALVALACGEPKQSEPTAEKPAAAPPAQEAPQAGAPALEADEPELDARAVAIVRRAGDFLGSQTSFAVAVESAHESVQETGEKLEFAIARRLLVRRPDRFRVQVEPATGGERSVHFDGKTLTVLDADQRAYAQVERPGDIDGAIAFLRDVLDTPMPVAELMTSDPGGALQDGLEVAYVVGVETVGGVACDHVFLRNARVDAQFWVATGDTPTLQRAVLVYRNEPGAPAFRARLTDWQLGADTPDSAFAFVPPEGAARIQFAIPAQPAGSPGGR